MHNVLEGNWFNYSICRPAHTALQFYIYDLEPCVLVRDHVNPIWLQCMCYFCLKWFNFWEFCGSWC